ncbi:hypothetical protein NEDG_01096 [Nematocida displodere]|uniref:Uncharacterized protein n=1 Tax=Nematocida displodere TaxID=1805483 RepID=A0A177EAJ6_9MICR|nr:hypothetical protein NEDG_01096 [Nematocida displodere]
MVSRVCLRYSLALKGICLLGMAVAVSCSKQSETYGPNEAEEAEVAGVAGVAEIAQASSGFMKKNIDPISIKNLPSLKRRSCDGFSPMLTKYALSSHLLPPTAHTEATIAFFDKWAPGNLKYQPGRVTYVLEKNQTQIVVFDLNPMELEGIPPQIEPGLVFSEVRVLATYLEECEISLAEVTAKLAKLFQAFDGVCIDKLHMEDFDIEEDLSPAPEKRPLFIASQLSMCHVTSSFFEWFCGRFDLGACSPGLSLKIDNSPLSSIACIDSLGIKTLSGLFLNELGDLACLSCQLLEQGRVKNSLELWYLSSDITLSPKVSKAIAEKDWDSMRVDIEVWFYICSSTHMNVVVKNVLELNVGEWGEFLEFELSNEDAFVRVKTLVLENNSVNDHLTLVSFRAIMQWIKTEFLEVETIELFMSLNILIDDEVNLFLSEIPIPPKTKSSIPSPIKFRVDGPQPVSHTQHML